MADKALKALLKELQSQGFRIKESKKGYMVYPPDPAKPPVAIHHTPSDHRAWANMITQLRRCGFIQQN